MSSAGSSPVRGGWLDPEKGFHDEVQLSKQSLALALRALCRLLRPENMDKPGDIPPLQAEAAARLGCTPDSLSRYLNGPRVPPQEFAERLYKEACADAAATGQDVSISLDALLVLHASAMDERRGRSRPELNAQLNALAKQLSTPSVSAECANHQRKLKQVTSRLKSARRKLRRLRTEVAELKAERSELRATEAGLRELLAASGAAPLLPVPRPPRDRQQSTKAALAAQQLATQATELNNSGREDLASTLLRQSTAELMTPAETALVVLGLRQRPGGGPLADDLIHVYGRDQEKEDVMMAALELHEGGAVDDAGTMLRAALGPRAGTAS